MTNGMAINALIVECIPLQGDLRLWSHSLLLEISKWSRSSWYWGGLHLEKNHLTKQGRSSPWLGAEPTTNFPPESASSVCCRYGFHPCFGDEIRYRGEESKAHFNFFNLIKMRGKNQISIRFCIFELVVQQLCDHVWVCESAPACVCQEALLSRRNTTVP